MGSWLYGNCMIGLRETQETKIQFSNNWKRKKKQIEPLIKSLFQKFNPFLSLLHVPSSSNVAFSSITLLPKPWTKSHIFLPPTISFSVLTQENKSVWMKRVMVFTEWSHNGNIIVLLVKGISHRTALPSRRSLVLALENTLLSHQQNAPSNDL